MRLTEEEKKICKKYRKRDENNEVHCLECPLVIDAKKYVCKANITEVDYLIRYIREQRGEEDETLER